MTRKPDLHALVTGGNGFIGSHLVRHLLSVGYAVTVVDRGLPPEPYGAARTVAMQLPSPELQPLIAAQQFDAVFHLAGTSYVPLSLKDPINDLRQNTEVTVGLLEALKTHSPGTRLVYVSSAAVYGNPSRLPVCEEDHPLLPVSPYGVSKLSAESYVSLYSRIHGLRAASVRPFSVFGPGLRKQVVFDLIRKLCSGAAEIEVIGTGQEMRDFVYCEDVAIALHMVLNHGTLTGEAYNVATGHGTTIDSVIRLLCTVMGVSPKVRYTGHVRPGDPLKWVADISRISRLGFVPKTPLSVGLERVVEWARTIVTS